MCAWDVSTFVYVYCMHQDVHACFEPICFSVLKKWRRWLCIVKTFCVNILPTNTVLLFRFGMLVYTVWWASHFYLHSADVLSKASVGRAAFKKETVNWPGYGLLQLNLKH